MERPRRATSGGQRSWASSRERGRGCCCWGVIEDVAVAEVEVEGVEEEVGAGADLVRAAHEANDVQERQLLKRRPPPPQKTPPSI